MEQVLTAAKTYYTQNNQSYAGLTPQTLDALVPGITAVVGTSDSTGPSVVSMDVTADGNGVIFAATRKPGGLCWGLLDETADVELEGYTGPGELLLELPEPPPGGCNAIEFDSVTQIPGSIASRLTPGGSIAAQASLYTALTAAKSYYTQNDQTFDGLNPETFKQLNTGLRAVDGKTSSTSPTLVSLHVTAGGYGVIFSATWKPGAVCWAIVTLTSKVELDGFTGPGTLYVELPDTQFVGCDALDFNHIHQVPGTFTSTDGFGALPGSG